MLSQAGQVLQDTITDGSTPYTSTYSYDAAGRLVAASVPDNSLSYSFASSGGCGVNTAAGADGDRTGFTDTTTGGSGASVIPVSVSYCYDFADRLTSDTVSGVPSGASPLLAAALMSVSGPGQNLAYDAAGNITTLADESLSYDQENRHVSTTTSASPATTVTYTRDASGSVVKMETNITGGTDTVVSYTGGGGIQFTLDAAGHAQEETLSLPGGVTVSLQGTTLGSSQVWSYPDLHGDDTVTADGSGARSVGVNVYDPFGDRSI